MNRSLPPRRLARLVWLVLGWFAATIALPTHAADAVKKSFDVPAGLASDTLKSFASQAGREIVFAPGAVGTVQTKAVKGEFTPADALSQMLDGTGLVASVDATTGAFAVRKDASAPKNVPSPVVDSIAPIGPTVQMEIVEVTGTRVRGLLAGATAQPVITMSALDIERTGAQSLGDLFRYVPQVSTFTLGRQVNNASMTLVISGTQITNSARSPSMGGAAGRVTASLRGSSADGTLLLVDGRRVPKNNQTNGGDGYDLNGIPLAAVERMEVLLDGASSVYGADAQGGVINIILKKNYRGTELRLSYDNTFDKDAGTITGSLVHGFAQGKLHGMVTLNWEKANAMALRDRAFTASYDRRPYGGIDLRRNTLYSGAGTVSRSGSVPLPGLTATLTAIPSGTSGVGLTTADYAAAGSVPALLNLAQFQDFSSTYKRRGVVASLRYDHAHWLELYSDLRLAENKNYNAIEPIQAVGLSIPGGYPGNPFGIAVSLSKAFYGVQPQRVALDKSDSVTLGARGALPGDWRYEAYVSRVSGHTQADAGSGTSITQARLNAAIAAGQQPNLFYDSSTRANPNAAGVLESLTDITTDEEASKTWTYAAQADGPLYKLPAGKIMVAAGVERREESVDFPRRLATDISSALSSSRHVSGLFAEVNVPVFSPEQRVPLLHQVNLSGSYRWEDYSTGASAKNPRGGVAWRPISWLHLRYSYGKGFKVPRLVQSSGPSYVQNNVVGVPAPADPLRGGELVSQVIPITYGGNPKLRPEKVKNTSAGVVLEVPPVKGLSFSFDYFDNQFTDKVGSITFVQRLQLFPDTITRGTKLATDPASWAGPVTALDNRAVNVAYSRVSGYDYGVRYSRRTALGEITGSLNATKYTRNESFGFPGGTIVTTITPDLLPTMITGNVFLQDGAWSTGVLATRRGRSKPVITTLFVVTDTPSATRWDWQGSYDFGKAAWLKAHRDSWLGRRLRDTKLGLTIFNVFNTRPPFDYNYLPDNTVLDARLRRYALSLRRTF